MPKAIRGGAITAAASLSMPPSGSPSTAPSSCSHSGLPMCSPLPGRPRTQRGSLPRPNPRRRTPAHVVTTTTHKTLRGPRGGMILTNDAEIARRIDSAVFPGLQGGPLMHVIAAKAVALGEALQPSFAAYAHAVVANAQILAATLAAGGLAIVSGGTDTHLLLVDLRPLGLTGRDAEQALERAGITCNKNGIPFDPQKPTVTSGIRLGSPAATTRGFGVGEFRQVGEWIAEVLHGLARDPDST